MYAVTLPTRTIRTCEPSSKLRNDMNSILVALAIAGGGPEPLIAPVDGTILFLENSKKIVRKVTDSNITHVALIMNVDGKSWVYEAEPPRVRRVPLMTFYQEIGERNRDGDESIRIWLMPPNQGFNRTQRKRMLTYLDHQLGRRYSIKNYVRDVHGDGIHCAQLTANTLCLSGRFSFKNTASLSPARLVTSTGPVYTTATEALVTLPRKQHEKTWCERSSEWWARTWKWCKWGSGECWRWCWN